MCVIFLSVRDFDTVSWLNLCQHLDYRPLARRFVRTCRAAGPGSSETLYACEKAIALKGTIQRRTDRTEFVTASCQSHAEDQSAPFDGCGRTQTISKSGPTYLLLAVTIARHISDWGVCGAAAHGATDLGNQIFVMLQKGQEYPIQACDVRYSSQCENFVIFCFV